MNVDRQQKIADSLEANQYSNIYSTVFAVKVH